MQPPSWISALCVAVAFLIALAARAHPVAPRIPSADERKVGAPDAITDKARELYNQGRKDLDASRWAEARASLLASWALKKHWQIAANLGDCKMQLGLYADAAEHYAYYLREAPADRKQKAQGEFEKARVKVGAVSVKGDRTGADVLVDGVSAGRSPLAAPVFVMPGKHAFQMRLGDQVLAEQAIEAAAGGRYDVMLAAKAEPVKPTQPAPPQAKQPLAGQRQAKQSPLSENGQIEKRSVWPAIAIGGAGAVGLAGGIAFTMLSNSARADAESARAIVVEADGYCLPSVMPPLAASCNALHEATADRDRYRDFAVVGYVLAGTAAVATTVFLLWPRRDAKKKPQAVPVWMVPFALQGSGGVVFQGVF